MRFAILILWFTIFSCDGIYRECEECINQDSIRYELVQDILSAKHYLDSINKENLRRGDSIELRLYQIADSLYSVRPKGNLYIDAKTLNCGISHRFDSSGKPYLIIE